MLCPVNVDDRLLQIKLNSKGLIISVGLLLASVFLTVSDAFWYQTPESLSCCLSELSLVCVCGSVCL